MNKYTQSLIEDYKQTIERLQRECTEKTNMNIKLKQNANDTYEMYKALMDSFNILNKEKIKLERKLKIAQEALDKIISNDKCNRCDGIGYNLGCLDKDCEIYIAQQALQKMKEVENEN